MSKKLTQQEFLDRATLRHGNKYDYSESIYNGLSQKVKVICLLHGEFYTRPRDHIFARGRGCKKCGYETIRKTKKYSQDEWLKKVTEIHGFNYDYKKTKYIDSTLKVTITCKSHGDFLIAPNTHLLGVGCRKCGTEKAALSRRKNIDIILNSHSCKFRYDFANYKNLASKIKIQCPHHGWFVSSVSVHLRTKSGGCNKCLKEIFDLSKSLRSYRQKNIHQQRKKTDVLYNLRRNLRSRISNILKKINKIKTVSTIKYIDCTYGELKIHLERQFLKGMTWENRAEWHIDHIIPLSSAKTEEDVIKLNHYTNLRPLWAADNLRKSNKLETLL